MARLKVMLAAVVLAALVGSVPMQAQAVKVIISGSSALWQAMALAAYNGNNTQGNCVSGGTAPCFHYTAGGFILNDSRPATKGGSALQDKGNIWIIWDSASPAHVWAYVTTDSVVGQRCYFAHPRCTVLIGSFPAAGNLINSALWGDGSSDSTPPAAVQALFTGGIAVNTAATDIRPEDGLFATCRANSVLGGGPDGLAGLGYGTNASGVCPTFGAALGKLVGSDILSGYPGSTSAFHVVAYNISGTDPFTNQAIPKFTTVSVGAAPIVFITARDAALGNVTNATDGQLQTVFSGTTCKGNVFAGGGSGNINAYLREMLSGTMNTTEYTVFRYPDFSGNSQEAGVNATNPLAALGCGTGGSRYRGIGTGEVVKHVLNSQANFSLDGIAYTFFSFGNVSSIANSAHYGYLTLNGVDPIFHQYGSTIDPVQPSIAGALPGAANVPCSGGFPCSEKQMWSGNLSFPNVRNGSYRAWSVIRLVSDGTALAAAKLLVKGSNTFAATSVPDYIPAVKVGTTDPGLFLLRSHYTRFGIAPVNIATTGDKGGDEGGCILSSSGVVATSDTTTKLAQAAPGGPCVSVP
ncbi:MAG TPA: hypothetical protein VMT53_01775 [Terriglobales bacterium]|nr:hypothetical protein [Terriglobales bacterium]